MACPPSTRTLSILFASAITLALAGRHQKTTQTAVDDTEFGSEVDVSMTADAMEEDPQGRVSFAMPPLLPKLQPSQPLMGPHAPKLVLGPHRLPPWRPHPAPSLPGRPSVFGKASAQDVPPDDSLPSRLHLDADRPAGQEDLDQWKREIEDGNFWSAVMDVFDQKFVMPPPAHSIKPKRPSYSGRWKVVRKDQKGKGDAQPSLDPEEVETMLSQLQGAKDENLVKPEPALSQSVFNPISTQGFIPTQDLRFPGEADALGETATGGDAGDGEALSEEESLDDFDPQVYWAMQGGSKKDGKDDNLGRALVLANKTCQKALKKLRRIEDDIAVAKQKLQEEMDSLAAANKQVLAKEKALSLLAFRAGGGAFDSPASSDFDPGDFWLTLKGALENPVAVSGSIQKVRVELNNVRERASQLEVDIVERAGRIGALRQEMKAAKQEAEMQTALYEALTSAAAKEEQDQEGVTGVDPTASSWREDSDALTEGELQQSLSNPQVKQMEQMAAMKKLNAMLTEQKAKRDADRADVPE